MKSALQTLKEELYRIQQAENDCVDETGNVFTHCRYRYTLLITEARKIKDSMEVLERLLNTNKEEVVK